ncbi:hypothetical protein BDN72DRAFT_189287 [Pluteus cervinus]|uniref:Uncharacterized protein n=1 Tax=Pluteus cervinus TaxID=181527 RepID=A0ACD3AJ46_9AGAR|nr:hypothetical protein BDN72DRAFT_189287 [Pluteus cervinus]
MTSELTVSEETITQACTAHEQAHWDERDYRRCLVIEQYFIKFNEYDVLEPEVMTQMYVSQYAESDASAPRVPKVLHFFKTRYMGYLVMDYINLTSPPDLHSRAAEALQWLRNVPLPRDHVGIGPLGNGFARHRLFKDFIAPLHFSSTEALERYLNKALTKRPRTATPIAPVVLRGERLVFIQSDVDISNFGVDHEGKTVLLDFGDVGILSESFASYTMNSMNAFTGAVAGCLDWPKTSNLTSMSVARQILWMYYDPTLGLDNDGNPKGNPPYNTHRLRVSKHTRGVLSDEFAGYTARI